MTFAQVSGIWGEELTAPTSANAEVSGIWGEQLIVPDNAHAEVSGIWGEQLLVPDNARAEVSGLWGEVLYARNATRTTKLGVTDAFSTHNDTRTTKLGATDVFSNHNNTHTTKLGVVDLYTIKRSSRITKLGTVVVFTDFPMPSFGGGGDGDRILLLGKRISKSFVAPNLIDLDLQVLGGVGQLTITLNDPQFRVVFVEFQHRIGSAPLSPWLRDATEPYIGSCVVNPGEISMLGYRVSAIDDHGTESIMLSQRIWFDSDGNIVAKSDPTDGGDFDFGPMGVDYDSAADTIDVFFQSMTGTARPKYFDFDWKWITDPPTTVHFGPRGLLVPQWVHRRSDAPGVDGHKYDITPGPTGYHPDIAYQCTAYDAGRQLVLASGFIPLSSVATLTTAGPHS